MKKMTFLKTLRDKELQDATQARIPAAVETVAGKSHKKRAQRHLSLPLGGITACADNP